MLQLFIMQFQKLSSEPSIRQEKDSLKRSVLRFNISEKNNYCEFLEKIEKIFYPFFLENAFGSESQVAFFEEALLSYRNN